MPRKTPLPDREIGICRRVREVRRRLGMSRVAFAQVIGVDSAQLANVEHARAPVRYDLGRRICERFEISPMWLVAGTGPEMIGFKFSGFVKGADERALFTWVYDSFLQHRLENANMYLKAIAGLPMESGPVPSDVVSHWMPAPLGAPAWESYAVMLDMFLRRYLKALPDDLGGAFVKNVCDAAARFWTANKGGVDAPMQREPKVGPDDVSQVTLDTPSKISENESVTVADIIAKVRRRCPPGLRAQLAADLGVSRQAVHLWLIGKAKPTAENALRLLGWIDAREAKQQSPGGVRSTTRAKTRNKESDEDTNKSGPPKL